MSIALAIVAAVGWAATDYLGGVTARKIGSSALTFYFQVVAAVVLLPVALLSGSQVRSDDMLLGLLAGCFNVTGFILLVEGMRVRRMGAVVTTSAVAQTLPPVFAGIVFGNVLNAPAVVGICVSILGVALVSSTSATDESSKRLFGREFDSVALVYGIGSGLLFGAYFIILSQTSRSSGVWPLVSMRAAVVLVYAFCRVKSVSLRPIKTKVGWSAIVTVSGVFALACYTAASRIGPLAIVATIVSTSPAGTVAISHFIGHERISRIQTLGVAATVLGVALLSIS